MPGGAGSRRAERRAFSIIADKQAVVDAILGELAADADRVRPLCSWDWLTDALEAPSAA